MAKLTVEELYRGEKYDIMSAVTVRALLLGVDERTEDGRTWIETELVRQTLIAVEKMKTNGDCIAEGEPQKLEHNNIQWIAPSEISNYVFCLADVEILERIKDSFKETSV